MEATATNSNDDSNDRREQQETPIGSSHLDTTTTTSTDAHIAYQYIEGSSQSNPSEESPLDVPYRSTLHFYPRRNFPKRQGMDTSVVMLQI